jgi:hypothetical protein
VQLLIAKARAHCRDDAAFAAVVNAVDSLGRTPLEDAAQHVHFAQTPDYLHIVECLRAAGGKFNSEPKSHALRTIELCAAAARGDVAQLHRFFVAGGVSVIEYVGFGRRKEKPVGCSLVIKHFV